MSGAVEQPAVTGRETGPSQVRGLLAPKIRKPCEPLREQGSLSLREASPTWQHKSAMAGLVTLRCFRTAGLVASPNVFDSSDSHDFKSLFNDAWLRRPPLRPAPERLQAPPAHRLHVPDVWLEPLGRLCLWRPGLRLGAPRYCRCLSLRSSCPLRLLRVVCFLSDLRELLRLTVVITLLRTAMKASET